MEQGSLDELALTRSVIKHIRKNSENLVTGAAVGHDYARMGNGVPGDIITTEAYGEDTFLTWVKAVNNFAVSGGKILGARIVMLLPEDVTEVHVKEYMQRFNSYADATAIQITGGHSEVSENFSKTGFLIQLTGLAGEYNPNEKKIKSGDLIIMTKHAGLMGTSQLAMRYQRELAGRFSDGYIKRMQYPSQYYSIERDVSVALDDSDGEQLSEDIHYMHTVSYGGVYGALWQLGKRVGEEHGISVVHNKIHIRQESVELSEYFNINPYQLFGSGSLLMVTSNQKVLDRLLANDIEADIIGEITADNNKSICYGEETRFLTPVRGDEIYKVILRRDNHEY